MTMKITVHFGDSKWITVHPNGEGSTGTPVKVSENGTIEAGMGGKFNGEKIGEIRQNFVGPKSHQAKPPSSGSISESYEKNTRLKKIAKEVSHNKNLWQLHGKGMSQEEFGRKVRAGEMHNLVQKVAAARETARKEREKSIAEGIHAAQNARLPAGYSVRQEGDNLIVSGDFDNAIHQRMKRLGGRWDGTRGTNRRVWIVSAEKGKSFPRVFKNAIESMKETKKAVNLSEVTRWLGYLKESAEKGHLYGRGLEKLNYLKAKVDEETGKRIDREIQEARSSVERMKADKAERQAAARKEYNSTPASERNYLNVPYAEKDLAKRYGAKWDSEKRRWYFPGKEVPKELSGYIGSHNPSGSSSAAGTSRGRALPNFNRRIDENDPSLWGHELLGHEGEHWNSFLSSPGGREWKIRMGLEKKENQSGERERHWAYSPEAMQRALRGEDSMRALLQDDGPDNPFNYLQ